MARTHTATALLAGLLAMPLVAGCAQLGLPAVGGALDADTAAGAGDVTSPAPLASPSFFSSDDGYTLTLPIGWVGVKASDSATAEALSLLAQTDPALGAESTGLLDATGARTSMLAIETPHGDPVAVPSGIAILVMPTNGASNSETQKRFWGLVNGLTTLDDQPTRSVVSVPAGDARRYDVSLHGDVLSVQLRLYLFTVGDDGVVILGGRDAASASDSWPDLDAIVKSLRFGV